MEKELKRAARLHDRHRIEGEFLPDRQELPFDRLIASAACRAASGAVYLPLVRGRGDMYRSATSLTSAISILCRHLTDHILPILYSRS